MSKQGLQSVFIYNLARFIIWCFQNGYELTLGEGYVSSGTGHMKNSLHYERLAQDLNFFKNGIYMDGKSEADVKEFARIGAAWKSFLPDNRWGGDFKSKDFNHFSLSIGDGRA